MRRAKLSFAVLWYLALAAVNASACRTTEPQLLPQVFADKVAALQFVSRHYAAQWQATDTEYVGTLYLTNSGYLVSIARGCPSADSFRYPVHALTGAETIALWHSHGAPGPARDWFSADDVALVRQLALPFYLFTPSGELKVLRPGAIGRMRAPAGRRPSHRSGRGVAGERVLVAATPDREAQ